MSTLKPSPENSTIPPVIRNGVEHTTARAEHLSPNVFGGLSMAGFGVLMALAGNGCNVPFQQYGIIDATQARLAYNAQHSNEQRMTQVQAAERQVGFRRDAERRYQEFQTLLEQEGAAITEYPDQVAELPANHSRELYFANRSGVINASDERAQYTSLSQTVNQMASPAVGTVFSVRCSEGSVRLATHRASTTREQMDTVSMCRIRAADAAQANQPLAAAPEGMARVHMPFQVHGFGETREEAAGRALSNLSDQMLVLGHPTHREEGIGTLLDEQRFGLEFTSRTIVFRTSQLHLTYTEEPASHLIHAQIDTTIDVNAPTEAVRSGEATRSVQARAQEENDDLIQSLRFRVQNTPTTEAPQSPAQDTHDHHPRRGHGGHAPHGGHGHHRHRPNTDQII